MPAPHDLDPDSLTEEERLGNKRYDAYLAFEQDYAPVKRSRLDHFGQGLMDHRNTEQRQYETQQQQRQNSDDMRYGPRGLRT